MSRGDVRDARVMDSHHGSSYRFWGGIPPESAVVVAPMLAADNHRGRPTMSMLGDHQVFGDLQQLVRRQKEGSTTANQSDAKPGIHAMATAAADARKQNTAIPGSDQRGREFGGPDKKEHRQEEWEVETIEVEDEGMLGTGVQEKKRNWWPDSWLSSKFFGGDEDPQGDQLSEVTDSPLKRLVRSPFGWVPKFNLTGRGRQEMVRTETHATTRTRRKGRGRGRGRGLKKERRRTKGDLAIQLAKKATTDPTMLEELENKFCAASSQGSKGSKARLVENILQAIENSKMAYPLSVRSLKMLAATLHKAGYTSAEQYLGEAKLQHVELGFRWTEQLDLAMRRCKAAVTRGKGPRKRAPELPANKFWNMVGSPDPPGTVVKWAKELFTFASIWMLRCAELLKIKVEDVVLNSAARSVTLMWWQSKCDQTAGGVSRVLQCVCAGKCSIDCPWRVSEDLVKKVLKFKSGAESLCILKKDREKATKAQVVASWSRTWAARLTGHSARRTGALTYIRNGWQISQVAYLGRWKSGVIYNYAAEALESLPVNKEEKTFVQHLNNKEVQGLDKAELGKEALYLLELEVAEFKRDSKKAMEALKKEVEDLESNFGSALDTPPNVQSIVSKVVHKNISMVANTPPALWKTWCGWHFRGGNFVFVSPNTEVSCSKCLSHMGAQCKEVGMSTLEPWTL